VEYVWQSGGMVQYRAVATQNKVSGGSLTLKIQPYQDAVLRLNHLTIGKDIYGAGRVIRIYKMDGSSNIISVLLAAATATANYISLPSIGSNAALDNNVNSLEMYLFPKDQLYIVWENLAQTETATISFEAFQKGNLKPTYSWAGLADAGDVVEAYNKVV